MDGWVEVGTEGRRDANKHKRTNGRVAWTVVHRRVCMVYDAVA